MPYSPLGWAGEGSVWGPAPLLCCPLGQSMKGVRGEIVQGSLHRHPGPAPALTGRYLWEIKRTMGWGGAGARSFGPRSTLLSGFKDEGIHPERDLRLVSKSLSKDSFQPALSTVSVTARCRPPPSLRV